MADNKNLVQSIFGRLFSGDQESQVREWVRQIAENGADAKSARESLLSIKLEMLMPILAKLGKERDGAIALTANMLYKSLMDDAVDGVFAQPEDLTIGSEKLSPKEFLDRYGNDAFKKRYGVAYNSVGGNSLLTEKTRR